MVIERKGYVVVTRKTVIGVAAGMAAGALLVACGSSSEMVDVATDEAGMRALIEQGLAGEETIMCVGGDGEVDGEFYIAAQDRFRFDIDENDYAPSVLSADDREYVWVPGEDTGVTTSGAGREMFEWLTADHKIVDLASSELDVMDECGVYTGGDEVFQAPDEIDFVTVDASADVVELRESSPRLVELLFG